MILPNDILIRATSDGQTVWVSQRMVCEACGVNEKDLTDTYRTRYKSSLPPSWQKVADQSDFFLGDKPGKAWRWGRKGGLYYYDYDHIPNRKPTCYRDLLPSKEELIGAVEGQNLRGSRERQAEQRRMIREQVQLLIDNTDIAYYEEYKVGDLTVYTQDKARQMAVSVAWCRFLKRALSRNEYKRLGFPTQADFLVLCVDLLAEASLEGLRIKNADSLRKKIGGIPEDPGQLREWLVSGKYGNDNRRIIGKFELVDYTTGEVMKMDAHETAIMTYWLNPGGSEKDTKRELWQLYAGDMEAMGIVPVKPSTFNHYTNAWSRKMLSAKERHGKKHFKDTYRPYVPAKPLEFANSLWASDGSGVVPYRYQDQYGKWRMMKIYVMLISDVGSRYIAGYSVSRKGLHLEDGTMLRQAMRMALLDTGKTEVLDFISDNHGAYTGEASKAYLQRVCRNFRTIAPGNSQANPAETMFRLFKRRFKSYFKLPETSWNARSLESMANPDYYDIMALPTYTEAIEKLTIAIREWNNTRLENELTPSEWFHALKNDRAGQYTDRQYRRITGEMSKRDLSYLRSILTLERDGKEYKFDIPTDAGTVALIAQHMGYAPSFKAHVYWNSEGADVYTTDEVYMFTCPPAPMASKSMTEATPDSLRALAYYNRKGAEFEEMVDGFVEDVETAKAVMVRGYDFNIQDNATKEDYNAVHERISAAEYERGRAKREAKEKRAQDRERKKVDQDQQQAVIDYHKNHISDLSKYIK